MDTAALARVNAILAEADAELDRHYPGDRRTGQPVHTAYVTADRASPQTPHAWGVAARSLLTDHTTIVAGLDAAVDVGQVDTILAEHGPEAFAAEFLNARGLGWASDLINQLADTRKEHTP